MKEYTLPPLDGHTIYFAEYGNPKGAPIISVHGGPGSKSSLRHAGRFNLEKYRVILFDQRGCGKSTPLGSIKKNTTQDTLSDMERVREHLGIETWFVSGSSWGSTIALLYAIAHPKRVRGLLISSVFLADKETGAWMNAEGGASRLAPDVFEKKHAFLMQRGIAVDAGCEEVLKIFESGTLEEQREASAWLFSWEGNLFSAQSAISYTDPESIDEYGIASAKLFMHYDTHQYFLPEGYILENIDSIAGVPMCIVHGRYDILCPLERAYTLSRKVHGAELVIATSSGHTFTAEGETIRSLAYDRFLLHHTK